MAQERQSRVSLSHFGLEESSLSLLLKNVWETQALSVSTVSLGWKPLLSSIFLYSHQEGEQGEANSCLHRTVSHIIETTAQPQASPSHRKCWVNVDLF